MKIQNFNPNFCHIRNIQKQTPKNYHCTQTNNDLNFGATILSSYIKSIIKGKQTPKTEPIKPLTLEDFKNRKGKVTFEEYEEIKKTNKEILTQAKQIWEEYDNKHHMHVNPKIIGKTSLLLKNFFDKKYGSNYRIISIGTSPATLTEMMSNLGCEVIFMPLSGMNNFPKGREDSIETFFKQLPNFKKSLDYLKSKNKKYNDGKVNIFLDYTFSGTTLKQVSDFSQEYLKLDRTKMDICSLTSLLAEAIDSDSNADIGVSYRSVQKILTDVSIQKIGDLCNVPHFNLIDSINMSLDKSSISSKNKTEQELFKEFENFSRPMGRIFALCTIDEIMNLTQKKSEIIPD